MGIDVHLTIINWFCWTFEEPVPTIHEFYPKWFLTESTKGVNHFGTCFDNCIVTKFRGYSTDAKPSECNHPDVVMSFSLELEE